jgi:hypothetical protein
MHRNFSALQQKDGNWSAARSLTLLICGKILLAHLQKEVLKYKGHVETLEKGLYGGLCTAVGVCIHNLFLAAAIVCSCMGR